MSTVTAKIITVAAVAAIAMGAVFAYKHLSQSNHPPIQSDQPVVIAKEQEPVITPESTETALQEIQEVAVNSIEIPKIQTAAVPTNADISDTPKLDTAQITQTTEGSEYAFETKGILSGLITDKDTGEPVVGAEIVVYGASIPDGKLVTDVNGFYSLKKIGNSKSYMHL